MRDKLLKLLLHKCPKGDLETHESKSPLKLSCVFIFYKRFDLMSNILHCLNSQTLSKNKFEIILVEDKGGSEKGQSFQSLFKDLNISYYAPDYGWGKMGFMRNFGLSKSKGEIILFLDDDTVITDKKFLTHLLKLFNSNPKIDAVMPSGSSSYSRIKDHYNYHDPFFFTNRCMAYRKSCLIDLNGFDNSFIGQEDVELAIRFIVEDFIVLKTGSLKYYHPPLLFNNTAKGVAVGASFAQSKFTALFKFFLLINGSRWLPLYLLPQPENKYKSIFAFGFLMGFLKTFLHGQNGMKYQ